MPGSGSLISHFISSGEDSVKSQPGRDTDTATNRSFNSLAQKLSRKRNRTMQYTSKLTNFHDQADFAFVHIVKYKRESAAYIHKLWKSSIKVHITLHLIHRISCSHYSLVCNSGWSAQLRPHSTFSKYSISSENIKLFQKQERDN